MSVLTKIGLMDSCIDGSRENFDKLFGPNFDQFSCLFSLLQENGVSQVPQGITFSDSPKLVEFAVAANLSLDAREKTIDMFGCKISVTPTKQTTKIGIQPRK